MSKKNATQKEKAAARAEINARQKAMTSCVYCGKKIPENAPPYLAKTPNRTHPVCSAECRDATELYVEKDEKYKRFLYYALTLTAAIVIVGGLFLNRSLIVMGLGIVSAGLGMLLFPYPVSYFESFYSFPIKKVTLLTRVLGGVFTALGLFFTVASVLS